MGARYIDSHDFYHLKDCSLGERLKFIRQFLMRYDDTKKYTVTAIAERLNITHQSISAIERGESKNPSFLVIQRLAQEYHVTLDALTDVFYEQGENLFYIGKPYEMNLDFEFDEIYFNDNQINKSNEHIEDTNDSLDSYLSIFNTESRTGILFYEIHDRDIIRPLYHRHLNSELNKNDTVELISRLIFDTEKYSTKNKKTSEIHPEVQAQELLSKANKTLNPLELIDLMLKTQRSDS